MASSAPAVLRPPLPGARRRAFYDRLSPFYDLLARRSEGRVLRAALRLLDPRPGEAILEVGSDTGNCLLPMARGVGPTGTVLGMDASAGMIRRARRVLERGAAERVHLMRGDAFLLPLPPEGLDAVIATFTLELFDAPGIPRVLAELKRVLRPGGRAVVASLSKERGDRLRVRAFEWAHERFPGLVDCRPIYAARALEAAGFAVEEVRREESWLPVEVVRAIVRPGPDRPARTDAALPAAGGREGT
jgi:ubiquinone/menaquinone biosynthesis C-methylase UbiE